MFISDNTEFAEKITQEFNLAGNGQDISHFYDRFSEFIVNDYKQSFFKLLKSKMYKDTTRNGKKTRHIISCPLLLAENVYDAVKEAIANGWWVSTPGSADKTTAEESERKQVYKDLRGIFDEL
eukprot:Nk52_evm1s1662 gene=Nk52_evmTU1s1662